jgi:glycerol kinase
MFSIKRNAMEKDSRIKLNKLKVDGGMTQSDLLLNIQADILGIPIERPSFNETTALGCAFAAGLGVHIWNSLEELQNLSIFNNVSQFLPQITEEERNKKLKEWKKAVEKSFNLAND